MSPSHFLWPKPNVYRCITRSFDLTPVSSIEQKLCSMFPSGYPVLFSSGRSALVAVLKFLGYSRSDHIGVFPYASYCVLESIARVATPSKASIYHDANIIYHQWGYSQIYPYAYNPIIEDSVDTLVRPSTELFVANSNYEIWSLPKIIASVGGGVLWCKSEASATEIRLLRDQTHNAFIIWLLRLFGYKSHFFNLLWHSLESSHGCPSKFQTSEINLGLIQWDSLVKDREEKLRLCSQFIPSWLEISYDRLPSVVPVVLKDDTDVDALCSQLNICTGLRHFCRYTSSGSVDLVPVLPIPIHQDVPISKLRLMLSTLFEFIKS